MSALLKSELIIDNLDSVFRGKVRDNYITDDGYFVSVVTDRISAFDHVFDFGIEAKGQVLNRIASFFLEQTRLICPNWFIDSPHPAVSIGLACKPIPVEIVVRGYLTGHAWRLYKAGEREICGIRLEEGLVENQQLATPIITPAVKNNHGHDEDISKEDLLKVGYVSLSEWEYISDTALRLFEFGQKFAQSRNLILVDTKYEFGQLNNQILLMDEVHTPDSSRYFIKDRYEEDFPMGKPAIHLSKEFFRELLITKGFEPDNPSKSIEYSTDEIDLIRNKYVELYNLLVDVSFEIKPFANAEVSSAVNQSLNQLRHG